MSKCTYIVVQSVLAALFVPLPLFLGLVLYTAPLLLMFLTFVIEVASDWQRIAEQGPVIYIGILFSLIQFWMEAGAICLVSLILGVFTEKIEMHDRRLRARRIPLCVVDSIQGRTGPITVWHYLLRLVY